MAGKFVAAGLWEMIYIIVGTGQLGPKPTRSQSTRSQVNSVPSQIGPKSTRSQVNSVPTQGSFALTGPGAGDRNPSYLNNIILVFYFRQNINFLNSFSFLISRFLKLFLILISWFERFIHNLTKH